MKKDKLTQNQEAADSRPAPLHDEISSHARDLWEKYGRPAGRDEEIWLEAERQLLRGASTKTRKTGAEAVSAPAFARQAFG